jgi:hypothetical protein
MFAGMKRHPHPTGGSCCAQSSPLCAKGGRVRASTVTIAWPPLTLGADGQYTASLHRGQVTVTVLPQFVRLPSLRACKHCCAAAAGELCFPVHWHGILCWVCCLLMHTCVCVCLQVLGPPHQAQGHRQSPLLPRASLEVRPAAAATASRRLPASAEPF